MPLNVIYIAATGPVLWGNGAPPPPPPPPPPPGTRSLAFNAATNSQYIAALIAALLDI